MVLYRVLMRKLWILITIPILAGIAAFFLTSKIPDMYKSTAQLATGFTTNDQITVTNEGNNIREAGIKFNNLIETMSSEVILTMLSYQLIIHDLTLPSPFRTPGPMTDRQFTKADIDTCVAIAKRKLERRELLSSYDENERKLLDLIAHFGYANWQLLDDGLFIMRVRDTDYVKVQFASENPLLSSFVVNTLSEEYIRHDNNMKSSRSGQSVEFFEKLVADKKKELDEKTAILNEYRSNNNVVNYEIESTTRISQISDYEMKRTEAANRVDGIRLSLANAKRRLTSLEKEPSKTSSNVKILQLQSKISDLTKIYEDGGSTDDKLFATIKDLRYELQVELDKKTQIENAAGKPQSLLAADLENQIQQYELELQIAESNLRSINSTLAGLKSNVSGIASKEAIVKTLLAEVENVTKDYNDAVQRYSTERNKSLIAASPIQLVIRGQPNGYPERSKRYLIVAFAGVASFLLCVMSIVGIELIDQRLKNQIQYKKFVPIPLTGSINFINNKKLDLNYLFTHPVKSPEMEVFKHFLRKLRFELESSKDRVFLVTSTKDGEGKTFLTLCLVYSLSLVKKRVLIIDTNFRHNSLTQQLMMRGTPEKKLEAGLFVKGLIGKESGGGDEMNEEEYAQSIISPTNHKGINIVGNSGGDRSPSEIFAGRDFRRMINILLERYDYIFMEGASLNIYSDTKELVEYVDKVIAVFSSRSVIKQLDRESIDYLKKLNGKLMGGVLNGIEMKELKI